MQGEEKLVWTVQVPKHPQVINVYTRCIELNARNIGGVVVFVIHHYSGTSASLFSSSRCDCSNISLTF